MLGSHLANFCRCMAIARRDPAEVMARHAIESVDSLGMFAPADQQLIKRCPVVSPLAVKAQPPPEFGLADFAPPPFIQNSLIAGEHCLDAENNFAAMRLLLDQLSRESLGRRKCMIVAGEQYVGGSEFRVELLQS